ncbi:MAG: LytR/AlgR family response regulator transcription factor [Bacteroidia bacterium]
MPLRCLIVEDESMSRIVLEKLCAKVPDLELVASCEGGLEALDILQKEEVDVILLDIHMPDLSGIDLLESLEKPPLVIFTTADDQYALKAFEFSATDYLVKPVTYPRLIKALNKARKQLDQGSEPQGALGEESLFIRVDNRLVNLAINDIQWVEALGDYIRFNTADKRYTLHMTMKKAEERLPAEKFQRVHRGFIVNLTKIVDIEDNSIVIDKKVIPISKGNREALMKRLNFL